MIKHIKTIGLIIWQLPQNLLALIILAFTRYKSIINVHGSINLYVAPYFFNSGISLGNYIILQENYDAKSVLHEYGHCLQSQRLGWLYLLLIGLPSICGNMYSRIKHKSNKWYYAQPWEHWADKLGGVQR